ncbi:unnamed protein product [Amoebophrya sp. A120]|nr:unnamed protein product [Amoebophrya sp. A120]|eukprot:GSA120T00005399001.1
MNLLQFALRAAMALALSCQGVSAAPFKYDLSNAQNMENFNAAVAGWQKSMKESMAADLKALKNSGKDGEAQVKSLLDKYYQTVLNDVLFSS